MTNVSSEQIERRVERMFDCLDRQLMNGSIDQAEYDRRSKEIDRQAEAQYRGEAA